MTMQEDFLEKMARDVRNLRTRGFVVETKDPTRLRELQARVLNPCLACGGPTLLFGVRRAADAAAMVAACEFCGNEQPGTAVHEEVPDFEQGDRVPLPKERFYVVDPFKSFVEQRIEAVPETCCRKPMRLEDVAAANDAPATKRYVCAQNAKHTRAPTGHVVEVPIGVESGDALAVLQKAARPAANDWGSDAPKSESARLPGAPEAKEAIALHDKYLRAAYERVGGFQKNPNVNEHKAVVAVQAYLNNEREQTAGLAHFMRAVATDVTLTNVTHSTVVAFTHNHKVVGEAALQVCEVMFPPVSTPAERGHYIAAVLERLRADPTYKREAEKHLAPENVERMVNVTGGLDLEQTSAAIIEMFTERGEVDLAYLAGIKAKKMRETGIVRLLEPLDGGFESIGGYAVLKKLLRMRLVQRLKYLARAARLGLKMPRGIILFGQGGTGKTTLARALGAETKLAVIEIQDVKSKWVGESESNLRRVFGIANSMAPCILFKDEIDTMGGREGADGGVSQALFGMFLTELQEPNRQWFFLGCTNRPERLDAALVRPGRIDLLAPMLLPDPDARVEILRVHALNKGRPVAADVDLVALARRTRYFTGAELEALVERACELAFEREVAALEADEGAAVDEVVTMKDFAAARENFTLSPGETERRAETERFVEYARTHCNDRTIWEPYTDLDKMEESWAAAVEDAAPKTTKQSTAALARGGVPARRAPSKSG